MKKKLFIDLEKISEHMAKCKDTCDYFYHPDNSGIRSIWEMATYAVVCRKCDNENCVKACPNEALEKQADKVLKRYNMRCTSCKSCAYACHSGVIYPEFIPYHVSKCDYCLDRVSAEEDPDCVKSCKCGAIKYGEFKEDKTVDIYAIGENVVVRSVQWERNVAAKKVK